MTRDVTPYQSNLEFLVVNPLGEGGPLIASKEQRVLRGVVGIANGNTFLLDCNRNANVDDAARVGETGLLKVLILHWKSEF